jgi:hypothetical protein
LLLTFHQYPICIPLLPHSLYMPCPSHPHWLYYSNYIWRSVQVMSSQVKLQRIQVRRAWRPRSESSSIYPSVMIRVIEKTSHTTRLKCALVAWCMCTVVSVIIYKLNISRHMLGTFFPGLVFGTRAQI